VVDDDNLFKFLLPNIISIGAHAAVEIDLILDEVEFLHFLLFEDFL